MSAYRAALCHAMAALAAADPRALFMGQAVAYPGTAMSGTLDVPGAQRMEMPVAEELQLGVALGLAMEGRHLPVCVYPRWSFVLRAMDQLVNHVDALFPVLRFGSLIIRVGVPTDEPLHPGPQHMGDFTDPVRAMLRHTSVVRLTNAADVVPAYALAARASGATILVEEMGRY